MRRVWGAIAAFAIVTGAIGAAPAHAQDPGGGEGPGVTGQEPPCENELKVKNWTTGADAWAQEWLKLDEVQQYAVGVDVRVAVLDTGFAAHPTLSNLRVNEQVEPILVDEQAAVQLIGGVRQPDGAWIDCDGHGTEVASLIAAGRYHESSAYGVAPRATIIPIRISVGRAQGSIDDLAQGIYAAVEADVHIINISMETDSNYAPLREAIKYAGQNGVLVVAAAGNSGPDTVRFPAAYAYDYDHVISVGAIGQNGLLWEVDGGGSSHAPRAGVTVAAPGVGVTTTWPGDGNGLEDGTSFAAPFVTGTAALILQATEFQATPEEIKRTIQLTADPAPGADVPDEAYGYGVLNPMRAVTSVLPSTSEAGASGDPSPTPGAEPEPAVKPLSPPSPPDHSARDRTTAIGGVALIVGIAVMSGVAIVRAGRRRGWRPGGTR